MKRIFLLFAFVLASCIPELALADFRVVKTVIAPVVKLWSDETYLKAYHEELKGKFSDTPSYEELRDNERWVMVVDDSDPRWYQVIAARAPGLPKLEVGDIVELKFSYHYSMSKYADLSQVTSIKCRRAEPDFEQCKKGLTVGAFGEGGKREYFGE